MKTRIALLVAALLLGLIVYGCVHRHGGEAPRADLEVVRQEVRQLQDQVAATDQSIEISRDTAARVDIAGAETRQRATQARDRIVERIEAEPVPVGAGSPDPVVMHEADEAYAAAIRAACRVQRTSECPASAAASD